MSREDLTTIIHEEIATAASYLGIPAQAASDLALQVEDRVRLRVAGCDVKYIGKIDRRKRASLVRAEFTGNNILELARRHNLSERRIRQILQEHVERPDRIAARANGA